MLYSISAFISLLAVWFLLFGGEARLFGLILILLLVIPFSILTYLDIKTSEFVVTNKRVIVKVGVIRRYSLELLLSKIEGLRIEQGILGRIFDYGTVVASGTGSSQSPFFYITRPLQLQRCVYEQIEKLYFR